MAAPRIVAPRSWQEPATHYLRVLDSPWYQLVARLQDAVSVGTTRFWSERGACNLHLPITTGSVSSPIAAGSDSGPVRIDLLGETTYLADSMQFMLEYGCRLSNRGCYYLMPSFRSESADTTHLCQFFHSEAEIVGGLDDVISTVEAYFTHLVHAFLRDFRDPIAAAAGGVEHLERALAHGFKEITFDDAILLLNHHPDFVRPLPSGVLTISRRGEQKLLELLGEPLWVTHMPHLSVPFYQAFADSAHQRARNADLLAGIGEIVGSGQRHTTHEELLEALELHAVPLAEYQWYADLKKRYPLRTSGFGMGVERFLLWVLRHDDIRDIPLLLRFNGQTIRP